MTKTKTVRNPFAVLATFAKAAIDPQGYESELAGAGMRDIRNIGLASLGAGAAARGVMGLLNMAKRRVDPMKVNRPAAIVTHVPVPVEKQAIVTDKGGFPWYYPGALLASGAGAIGGWKGMDMLFQNRRKAENEEAISGAKSDFEQALLGSYARPRKPSGVTSKMAGDELGEALDGLFDAAMVKQAINWDNVKGKLMGGYGMYALATGLGAGAMAYQQVDKGSDRNILQKALKQRMQRDYLSRPTEMYVVPKEVPVNTTAAEKLNAEPIPTPEDEGTAMADAPPVHAESAAMRPRRRVDSTILA